jgi:hypothetical protein
MRCNKCGHNNEIKKERSLNKYESSRRSGYRSERIKEDGLKCSKCGTSLTMRLGLI